MNVAVGDTVVVKECSSWGGVYDKFLIAPRKYLIQAFEGPINLAINVNRGEPWALEGFETVGNPEQFLDRVYSSLSVNVTRVENDDTITVVDGRCTGESDTNEHSRKWCLVEDWKDCHPQGQLDYETCGHEEES